jgi:hypothetical protein
VLFLQSVSLALSELEVMVTHLILVVLACSSIWLDGDTGLVSIGWGSVVSDDMVGLYSSVEVQLSSIAVYGDTGLVSVGGW